MLYPPGHGNIGDWCSPAGWGQIVLAANRNGGMLRLIALRHDDDDDECCTVYTYIFCFKINTLLCYTVVSVSDYRYWVLASLEANIIGYWTLGALFGIVLTPPTAVSSTRSNSFLWNLFHLLTISTSSGVILHIWLIYSRSLPLIEKSLLSVHIQAGCNCVTAIWLSAKLSMLHSQHNYRVSSWCYLDNRFYNWHNNEWLGGVVVRSRTSDSEVAGSSSTRTAVE